MNIINIPLTKTEDCYGSVSYELPRGVILGHDGENLTTELRIHFGEIEMIEAAEYYLAFSNGQGKKMDKHEGYLSAKITADILTVGDIQTQLTWSWLEVDEDGKQENPVKKTKPVFWRVLDSVELDETLQKEYPEILAMLMANLSKTGVEMRYNEGTRFVEWSYLGTDEWFTLFSADDVTEGASAYQVAVKNGFIGSEKEWLESLHGKTPVKGVDYFDGKDGVDGKDGQNGLDGVDGFSPEITTEEIEEGVKITTTHKDTEATEAILRHGKDGKDGKDGYTPQKGIDYFDGLDGKDGKDGYTPQKGVDYFDGENGKDGKDGDPFIPTEADYQAIADIVIAQFVDGNNMTY